MSLVDLTPTLLDLGGAPLEGVDGSSLRPLLEGGTRDDRPVWIVGTDGGRVSQLALREPPWKLIVHVESGEEEAYRLDLDPRERRSAARRGSRGAARAALRELERVEHSELSAEDAAVVESRLSDLGYL